jgi:diguanylate cyclase (GGDEF)-like protein
MMAALSRFPRGLRHIRSWSLWHLPPWISGYVIAVTAAYLVAIVVAVTADSVTLRDAGLFALLVAFGIVTVEATRRTGEPSGMVKDAHGVWYLGVAVLLPPLYALLAPVPLWLVMQLRVRRGLVYRRVFSVAAIGLSIAAASLAYHLAAPASGATAATVTGGNSIVHPLTWFGVAAGCAVLRALLNKVLVAIPVKGTDPAASWRKLAFDGEVMLHDLAEICIAVLVTFAIVQVPVALVFALPFGTLLHRSVRHTQLVSEARVDGKTGLLNASAWNQEAVTKIAQAVQSGAPLALAIIDIDHFKKINDRYGHLTGDEVLRAVTGAIRAAHRASDVCGRFGGEEFVLLLPDATEVEASRVAERLRAGVAALRVPAGDEPGAGLAAVTVSVGVAVLTPDCGQLTDLMAAADAALYYAKETGRNRVRLSPAASGPAGRPG